MQYIPTFSESEQKTRKQWRIAFMSLLGFNLLYTLFTSNQIPSDLFNPILTSIGAVSFLLLSYWVQNYCIYKKHGTGWVTFFLISIPFSCALSLYPLLAHSEISTKLPSPLLQTLSMIFSLAFCIPCYQMRKVNKRIQLEKRQFPKEKSRYKARLLSCLIIALPIIYGASFGYFLIKTTAAKQEQGIAH